MGLFFNIKVNKKKPSANTPDSSPMKVTVQKTPAPTTKETTPVVAVKKPIEKKTETTRNPDSTSLFTITTTPSKERTEIVTQKKDTASPSAAMATKETPTPAQTKRPLETADLNALAAAMGVTQDIKQEARQKYAPQSSEKPHVVTAPKENDLVVQKPELTKRKRVRKTKHDKVVEALAKSMERTSKRTNKTLTKVKRQTKKRTLKPSKRK